MVAVSILPELLRRDSRVCYQLGTVSNSVLESPKMWTIATLSSRSLLCYSYLSVLILRTISRVDGRLMDSSLLIV